MGQRLSHGQAMLGKHPNVVECVGVAGSDSETGPPALVLECVARYVAVNLQPVHVTIIPSLYYCRRLSHRMLRVPATVAVVAVVSVDFAVEGDVSFLKFRCAL